MLRASDVAQDFALSVIRPRVPALRRAKARTSMWITASPASRPVIAGLDPAIHQAPPAIIVARILDLPRIMDARVIGVRKHAVLRTAMPAHDGSPRRRTI